MAEWLAVITITTFAVISPGPDFAMVARNSLSLSRRAGILTAIGIGAGVLVHFGYTLLGIGFLIRETPALLGVLKLAGAAYLVWLGAKMLRSCDAETPIAANEPALSDVGALRIGFLTNALNPKVSMFYLAAFPQFIPASADATFWAFALVAIHSLLNVLWFSALVLLFSSMKSLGGSASMQRWLKAVTGTVFVGFGLKLATMRP